jgi:hypothetical protein
MKYPNVFLDSLQARLGGVEGLIEALAVLLSNREIDSTQQVVISCPATIDPHRYDY